MTEHPNARLSLKARLKLAGIEVIRVYRDDYFIGVRLERNGHQCHTTHTASYEYGLSLCGFFDV